MIYRREIDGLRAVAVLAVILFHAGFGAFRGGFVGVDVFFVISGYLITTLIVTDLDHGRFSVSRFYERRIRRILPALCVVVLACVPFAWLWLLPGELLSFSHSLMAVATFTANILFWRESGYFDTTTDLKPLLHTWSLAVEEQYYLLFPALLILLWKVGKRRAMVVALGLVFVASLALAYRMAQSHPSAAFYLLPTRVWEFIIGAFCGLWLARPQHHGLSGLWQEAAGWSGLLLILWAVGTLDDSLPFRDLFALAAPLGTALVIVFATPRTTVGRLLGNRICVGVGLISYSAYLWHQPLFAFARLRTLSEPAPAFFLALIAATLALAGLSWKYVETPFRTGAGAGRSKVFIAAFAASAGMVALGLAGHLGGGFSTRFPPVVEGLETPDKQAPILCQTAGRDKPCLLGNQQAAPKTVMLGDSHSVMLRTGLSDALASSDASILSFAGGWCAPLLDFGTNAPLKNPHCRTIMSKSLALVLEDKDITTVILAAEWSNYTQGRRPDDSGLAYYTDQQSTTLSLQENAAAFERALKNTLSQLTKAGKTVYIVTSVPEYTVVVPTALARRYLMTGTISLGPFEIDQAAYRNRNRDVADIFSRINDRNVHIVDSYVVFCPAGRCEYADASGSYYIDSNHLSQTGSKKLARAVIPALGL
ncbi:acyltransferase family protein [Insolitispirillum peregrinum]|uniref:acyltransferase family protein n=1 Tax=Insolitispirillum peregrinum TaxID=80876 RepID=UPI0036084E6C